MNMLGCLDVPTSGKYYLNGTDVSEMSDNELSEVRNREIGFIFQGFNLIANLNAIENVELPLIYRGIDRKTRHQLAIDSLKMVGLENRMDHKPSEIGLFFKQGNTRNSQKDAQNRKTGYPDHT